jgi:hypothetical protein
MKTHSDDDKRRQTQTRTGWTDKETRSLCRVYSRMLELQGAGLLGRSKGDGQTSKATLVRSFIDEHAPTRSKGSVEAKLMNLSAAREAMGLPIVDGYKSLPNMSTSTRDIASRVWGSK